MAQERPEPIPAEGREALALVVRKAIEIARRQVEESAIRAPWQENSRDRRTPAEQKTST